MKSLETEFLDELAKLKKTIAVSVVRKSGFDVDDQDSLKIDEGLSVTEMVDHIRTESKLKSKVHKNSPAPGTIKNRTPKDRGDKPRQEYKPERVISVEPSEETTRPERVIGVEKSETTTRPVELMNVGSNEESSPRGRRKILLLALIVILVGLLAILVYEWRNELVSIFDVLFGYLHKGSNHNILVSGFMF